MCIRDSSKVLSRKQAILDENTAGVEKQKKSGKQTARERIAMLLDGGSFVEQSMLANDTGVVAGSGTVDGRPVYVFAQDFAVMDGAMGAKQAKKIVKVLESVSYTHLDVYKRQFAAVFMGGCCRICAAGQLVAVGDDSIFRRFCAALSDADAGTLHTLSLIHI